MVELTYCQLKLLSVNISYDKRAKNPKIICFVVIMYFVYLCVILSVQCCFGVKFEEWFDTTDAYLETVIIVHWQMLCDQLITCF